MPMQVYYDDHCGMCSAQVRTLRRLDWLGSIQWLPMSKLDLRRLPGVTEQDLQREMHALTGDGRVLRGAYAVRAAALRIPLLVPLGVLMHVPGIAFISRKVYAWVAARRYRLSEKMGCPIHRPPHAG